MNNQKHLIGNFTEDWRPILEQAIAEMDYDIEIGTGAYSSDLALYQAGNRDTSEFFARVDELMEKERELPLVPEQQHAITLPAPPKDHYCSFCQQCMNVPYAHINSISGAGWVFEWDCARRCQDDLGILFFLDGEYTQADLERAGFTIIEQELPLTVKK